MEFFRPEGEGKSTDCRELGWHSAEGGEHPALFWMLRKWTAIRITRAPTFPASQAQTGPLRAEVQVPRTAQVGETLTLAAVLHNETGHSVEVVSGLSPLDAILRNERGEPVRWYTPALDAWLQSSHLCAVGPCQWDHLQLDAPLNRFNRWLPLPPGEYTVTVRMKGVFVGN
ncbi:hypothetical protein [Deinococcus multiflagellatus]|uniref:hypothetical protein n=1 Tax=Deinococcus multiflagellatus TaxID=1656887 RepID=UPI001CCE5548|nr:hypothetical protein [Deinococcus multiflagellatus]MBZ9713804.1 hypothetical protein [Deinococcus multiflagellatus]